SLFRSARHGACPVLYSFPTRRSSDLPSVKLYGEDIEDPKGDVFGVTKGLSTEFPGRVVNSPLAEASILGLTIGQALAGARPVALDRKSTRLNSSHVKNSYAVFCLKKK